MVGFRVSYSSWKLQQKHPAVVSRTCVVLPGTCALLYEPRHHRKSHHFDLVFALSSTHKSRAQEQRKLSPCCYCQDRRSAGARRAVVGAVWLGVLPLGWLGQPSWIPQAFWWAATLPSAGVCGPVSGGGWMCQSHVWESVRERKTYWCVYV